MKYRAWGGKAEGNSLSSETFDAMNIAFLGALRDAESEMRHPHRKRLFVLACYFCKHKRINALRFLE